LVEKIRMRAEERTRARRAVLPAVLCLLAVTLALSWPAVGRADGLPTVDLSSDPWFVGWSALLPPGYLGTDTDSSDVCVAGRIACVDRVARKLEQQVSNLGCDHNAVFSLVTRARPRRWRRSSARSRRSSPTPRG